MNGDRKDQKMSENPRAARDVAVLELRQRLAANVVAGMVLADRGASHDLERIGAERAAHAGRHQRTAFDAKRQVG